MKNNLYQPTPLYKELLILSLISKRDKVTQRIIANDAKCSLAMVNEYLDIYEDNGYIKIIRANQKTVKYEITDKGKDRIKYLSVNLLESSLEVYNTAKDEVSLILLEARNKLNKKNAKILMYGAGEVCEIMLYVINNSTDIDIEVLAIIDDDIKKQGLKMGKIDIISLDDIDKYEYDGVLISTYNHREQVKEKLVKKISLDKILEFY